ncbi:MAG: rhodanese-related sulfurtransferase [Pseudomonadota bacterium]
MTAAVDDSTQVFSFYRFVPLERLAERRRALLARAAAADVLGTVLLAPEGINGSLCGARNAVEDVLRWLRGELGSGEFGGRWSTAVEPPFRKLKVRLRDEIVTLGRPDLDPASRTGRRVGPAEWNRLLDDPGTRIIDTRNDYEIDVGRFPGAVNPATTSFRDFPAFAEANIDDLSRHRVAMYCTGGIRCEKASALLLSLGCPEVVQLDGGILGYLDTVARDDNRWQGECFVFDARVAVDADLNPGHYVQCHACRRPLGPNDIAAPEYEPGIACPACHDTLSPSKRAALAERRRQDALRAAATGTARG